MMDWSVNVILGSPEGYIDWEAKGRADKQYVEHFGMKVVAAEKVTSDEIWLVQGDKILGKVVNIK